MHCNTHRLIDKIINKCTNTNGNYHLKLVSKDRQTYLKRITENKHKNRLKKMFSYNNNLILSSFNSKTTVIQKRSCHNQTLTLVECKIKIMKSIYDKQYL